MSKINRTVTVLALAVTAGIFPTVMAPAATASTSTTGSQQDCAGKVATKTHRWQYKEGDIYGYFFYAAPNDSYSAGTCVPANAKVLEGRFVASEADDGGAFYRKSLLGTYLYFYELPDWGFVVGNAIKWQ
jgi:hypothetical protein